MIDMAEEVRQMIIRTKPDCIIYFNHIGCRHGGAASESPRTW